MKILVTGFEPFGGAVINPAYEAVKLLPDVIAGAEVIKIEIPTVFGRDEEVVRAAVEKHHPEAVHREGQGLPVDLREDLRAVATLPAVDRRVAPKVEMVVTEAACRVTSVASLAAAVIWKTA